MKATRPLRPANPYEHSPTPYLTLSETTVVRAANASAVRLLGGDGAAIIGKRFETLVEPADRARFRAHLAQCRRQQQTSAIGLMLILRTESVPADLSTTPIADARFDVAIVDLRERQQAAQERHELATRVAAASRAGAAKDQFLAALGPQLATPLDQIGAAALALRRVCADRGLAGVTGDLFASLERHLRSATQIARDLADLSCLADGALPLRTDVVDVHELVDQALDQLCGEVAAAGVRVDRRLKATHHRLRGDGDRLRQVFATLLGNAIALTPRAGRVGVRSPHLGSHVSVTVTDMGPGLAPEDRARIFDRFAPGGGARPPGLGLSLPIAQGIVAAHAGQLGVDSRGLGFGCTFEVRLPCLDGDGAPAPARGPRIPAAGSRARQPPSRTRILVVEDHADTARVMGLVLDKAGYDVVLAGSVAAAAAAFDDTIGLLLSDIALPDGSGHEVMRAVRARRSVPAIALSGYGTPEDVRRSRAAGFARHLVKPFEIPDLLRAIEQLLFRSPGRRPRVAAVMGPPRRRH